MTYTVSVRRTEEGYSACCPGLPGCWTDGRTEEEALENVRDAIADYLAVARELATADGAAVREIEVAA